MRDTHWFAVTFTLMTFWLVSSPSPVVGQHPYCYCYCCLASEPGCGDPGTNWNQFYIGTLPNPDPNAPAECDEMKCIPICANNLPSQCSITQGHKGIGSCIPPMRPPNPPWEASTAGGHASPQTINAATAVIVGCVVGIFAVSTAIGTYIYYKKKKELPQDFKLPLHHECGVPPAYIQIDHLQPQH